jgi:hypothetical protein
LKKHYCLNPLIKSTHYIDEFIMVTKLYSVLRHTPKIIVFGSMSLFSFMPGLKPSKRIQ